MIAMSSDGWGFQAEFAIVDDLLGSDRRTRCVDAFALAVLKTERQARRLFTYLAYQSPCFRQEHIEPLRHKLALHKTFGFAGALAGIDILSPCATDELVGIRYPFLLTELARIKAVRNKLFHGQVTAHGHSREHLQEMIGYLREWCSRVSESAQQKLGYDGFSFSSSYTKHDNRQFHSTLKRSLENLDDYWVLIEDAHKAGAKLLSTIAP